MEVTQHARYICAFCGKNTVKRHSTGIWNCRSCHKTVAGGAYTLTFVSSLIFVVEIKLLIQLIYQNTRCCHYKIDNSPSKGNCRGLIHGYIQILMRSVFGWCGRVGLLFREIKIRSGWASCDSTRRLFGELHSSTELVSALILQPVKLSPYIVPTWDAACTSIWDGQALNNTVSYLVPLDMKLPFGLWLKPWVALDLG